MNIQTISFLEKYIITSVAVTMSFQVTVRDELTILNCRGGGALSDTTKVGVQYRAGCGVCPHEEPGGGHP